MWSKRNIILFICVVLLLLYGVINRDTGKKSLSSVKSSPSVVLTADAGYVRQDKETEKPEATHTPESNPEWEEYFPSGMDVSDVSEEILGLLNISEEELSERIRIFANGQGLADREEVFCMEEYDVNTDNGTVAAYFYFVLDGEEEQHYNFTYIYYPGTNEFRIVA